MSVRIMTNNPLVAERYHEKFDLQYFELALVDFLCKVRDEVHGGAILLTHPLSGSVKPGETPYKSVMLETEKRAGVDPFSLSLIEEAIITTEKLKKSMRHNPDMLPARVLDDFQLIDLTLIESAFPSAGIH